MSCPGTDSEQQEAVDIVFLLPTDKAVTSDLGGPAVSPPASAGQDEKDGADGSVVAGDPRNGSPSVKNVLLRGLLRRPPVVSTVTKAMLSLTARSMT